jgi:hypothetical protein
VPSPQSAPLRREGTKLLPRRLRICSFPDSAFFLSLHSARLHRKNISQKRGVFFVHQKHVANAPRLPRISPRSHHQKTTSRTRYFPKYPQNKGKTKIPAPEPAAIFFSKY